MKGCGGETEHPVPCEREGDREHPTTSTGTLPSEVKDSDQQSPGNTKTEPWGKNTGNTRRQAALTRTTVWSDRKQSAGLKTPAADPEGTHAQKQQRPHGGSEASPWLPAASALHPALQPAGRRATPSLRKLETRARPAAPARPIAATSWKAQQTGRK
ncbi:hypothetical protein NDU88_007009 [Pleurodeles waltl]|uniref:Uncharacterized protein n=1 Tax=Pleurodeles waltl TaxID=8319 RepID=A0AAV7VSB2_PLEWA|nr:hypothetical protein NDU88_007009 [Pleurodeles waltl]